MRWFWKEEVSKEFINGILFLHFKMHYIVNLINFFLPMIYFSWMSDSLTSFKKGKNKTKLDRTLG